MEQHDPEVKVAGNGLLPAIRVCQEDGATVSRGAGRPDDCTEPGGDGPGAGFERKT